MKRVKYVDTYCYGAFHEMFNASLLTLSALAADRVDYVAHKRTIEAVLALSGSCLDPEKLHLTRISVPERYDRPLPVAVRYLAGALRNMWYVVSTPSSVPLVFNYNNAFALRGMNWLSRVFGRRVVVFCHGEIELLSPECKEHMGLIARSVRKRLVSFFVRKKKGFAPGLRFVVLGDSILDNLRSCISGAAFERFRSMDHPYLFPDDSPAVPRLRHSELALGTVGTMKRSKGLDNFHRFLEAAAPGSFSMRIVGRLDDEPAAKMEACGVEISVKGSAFLPREELACQLALLDYILYFYYSDSYRLIASGAIFDAIAVGRPIIALRNDFFDYLFRKFGDFGYLEPSAEVMARRVGRIASEGDPRYAEFAANIEKMRVLLHPANMPGVLAEMFDSKRNG